VDTGWRCRGVAIVDDAPPQPDRRRRSGTADRARRRSWHPATRAARNVVVVVALRAPLALALGAKPAGRRLLLATLIGAALSLAIELAQTAIPSRVTALDDLLLNATGTASGALVVCWIQSTFATERSTE